MEAKTDKLLLGVDIGTNESKGVLIDGSFRPIAVFSVPHTMENPQPNYFEMDAEIWWSDFCKISRGLMEQAGVGPEQIAGIGTSVMGCDCIAVDEHCTSLRKAILYGIDARSGPQIEALIRELGEEGVTRMFGHIPCSDDIATKILWIKENEPEVYEKTYKFLTGSSYLTAKLTGQYKIDSYLAKAGFDPAFGARPLKRLIVHTVENVLSRKIVSGEIGNGDSAEIVLDSSGNVDVRVTAKASR